CAARDSQEGGFAAHFRRAAAFQAGGRGARGYGAAPPASRLLRLACRRRPLPGPALTPETTAAPQAGNTGRPWPAPPPARRVRRARAQRTNGHQASKVNWRSIVRRRTEITRIR